MVVMMMVVENLSNGQKGLFFFGGGSIYGWYVKNLAPVTWGMMYMK